MRYSGRKFKLRIFPNNLFARLVFLITYPCLLLLSSHSYAIAETEVYVKFGFTTASTFPEQHTDPNSGSNFQIRFCFDKIIAGKKDFGRNCLRLRSRTVIYENRDEDEQRESFNLNTKYSWLDFNTRDEDEGNYSYHLGEREQDDLSSFETFLTQFPPDEALIIGAMCKQLSQKDWLITKTTAAIEKGLRNAKIDQNHLKNINLNRRLYEELRIATRCVNTVESYAGKIKISDFDKFLDDTFSQSKTSNSKSENSNQSNSDLEGQIKSHVEGIYALLEGKTGVSEKKRSSEEISAELGEIMEEIESIRPWKDKTSDDVQQTLERIKDLRATVEDIKDNISSIESWPDKQSEADIKEEENDLTARLTYLKARDTSLQEDLKENADLEELVESGSEKLTALDATIEDINQDIIDLTKEYDIAVIDLNSKLTQIDNLDGMLKGGQENLTDLKELQSNLTSNLSGAQSRKSELSPKLSDLVGEKSFLEITVENLKSQTEATASINDDLEATYKYLLSERDMLVEKLNTLVPRIDDFENRISDANEKLSEIKTLMTNNYREKSEMDILSTQAFALDQTVKSLEEQIEDLDDSVMAADGKLNRFERTCKRKPECKKALNF